LYDLLGHGLDGEPNIGGSQNGEAECAAAGECSTTWECSGTLAAACGSGTTGCPTDHGFWDEWCGCLHDETCTVFDQANAGSAGTPGDGGLAAYSFVDEDTGFWMGGEHLVETVQIGEEWIDLAVTDGRPGEPGEGGGGGPGITVVVDSGGSLYNVVVQGGGGGAGGCGGGGGKGGETGGSSFALYALGSSGMVAENVALTAGDGADGGNGGTSGDQGQGGPGGEPECPTGATTCTPGETLDTIAGGEGGPGGYGGHGAGGNGGVSCALFSDDDLDLAGGAALSSGSHGIAGAGVEDTPPAGDTGWGYAGQTTLDNAGVYCQ